MELFNADCLEKLKDIPNESVDLICCDLPYGQTGAKWDCKIDLDKLWVELKRVRKDTTPIFMFGTLKFGLELIASNKNEFEYRCYNERKGFGLWFNKNRRVLRGKLGISFWCFVPLNFVI